LVPFFFAGVKGLEHEVNHSPQSVVKVWTNRAIPLFRIYACMVWTGTALLFTLSSVTCTCLGAQIDCLWFVYKWLNVQNVLAYHKI
jgi:hypothetical protein